MNTSLEYVYSLFEKGHKICTDSRFLNKSDIFFALKGETFDGNTFVMQAVENGAEIAIADDPKLIGKERTIVVPCVLEFLQTLAKKHRGKLNIPVIGLTGSNGKTTTKELINKVLANKYKTFATQGNLNNHIGVPLSILSIKKETEIAIIEMGANHLGEVELLCSISQPTHGLITNIGKAHLEGFGSFSGVVKAKSELYRHLAENDGTVFINTNNPLLVDLSTRFNIPHVVKYNPELFMLESVSTTNTYLSLTFEIQGEKIELNSQLVGEYNAENILAAMSVGTHFGVSPKQAIDAIASYKPNNSRSQIVKTANNTVILDAYNANPSSMEQALTNFANLTTNLPKIAILGDMLELGNYSNEEHRKIAQLAKSLVGTVVFIGKHFEAEAYESLWFATQTECANYLTKCSLKGYSILLKGSRGIHLDKLMPLL